MNPAYFILILAWFVFALVHALLGTLWVRNSLQHRMGNAGKYYNLLCALISLGLFAWVLHSHFSIEEIILWRPPGFEKIIAAIMLLSGFAIIVIWVQKHFMSVIGIDAFLDSQEQPVFEQTGLHKHLRHPLYAGILLFAWGMFLGYPYMKNLVSACCLTLYLLISIPLNERKMISRFGDDYRAYQRRSKMLIPGVW